MKLVVVVRKDLNMRKGKLAAQVGHAVQAVIVRVMNKEENWRDARDVAWLGDGLSTKVVLGCQDHRDFYGLFEAASAAGLRPEIVTDVGSTEFHGQRTNTCFTVGPDNPERIDAVTGRLGLL